MAGIDLHTLKMVPLFSDLDESVLRSIAECINQRRIQQGEYICRVGEKNEWLYIVRSGYLRVSLPAPDGNIQFLATFASGACFGEMSLVTDEPVSANVTAVIDSDIYAIHKKDFLNILNTCPPVSVKLNRILSERLKETTVRSSSSAEKIKETLLSAIVGSEDHIDETVDFAYLVSSVLAKVHCCRVLLLICIPEYKLTARGKVTKKVIEQDELDGIFDMYSSSEALSVGTLKRGGWKGFQENDRDLMNNCVQCYDHIIAVSPEKEELKECMFFAQAQKIICAFHDKASMENVKESLMNVPAQSQKGIVFISSRPHDSLISRTGLRNFFRGNIFHYSSETVCPTGGIAKVARFLDNQSLGMVLGSGGARGFAHIGVMKVLERNGIEPDIYCGSSMGAIVAAMFAMGYDTKETEKTMRKLWTVGDSVFDYHFPYRSILKGKKLKKMAKVAYGDMTFDDLIYELYVMCADLVSGEEVVLHSGLLRTAIFASGAIPGILPPVRLEDKYLVDGGILNKVPASVLREKGVSNIIAVNVTPQRDLSLTRERDIDSDGLIVRTLMKNKRIKHFISEPNILQTISRSFNLVSMKLSSLNLGAGDFLIKPKVEHYDFFELRRILLKSKGPSI
jgi:NTE family protein/lysophospholipid hydrolase